MKRFTKKEIGTEFTVVTEAGHCFTPGDKVVLQVPLGFGRGLFASSKFTQLLDRIDVVKM